MLKRTVTYTDYFGEEQTDTLYFNLSASQIIEMEIEEGSESFFEAIARIVQAGDGKAIMRTFKDIILKAYGERSEDGKRFVRGPKVSEEFSQTAAYDKLFYELVMDPEQALLFIKSVLPQELMDKSSAELAARGITDADIQKMSIDELRALVAEKK